MKKYFKILFVSLLVTLTIGKGALASSMVLTPEQHAYYLKEFKGHIATLIEFSFTGKDDGGMEATIDDLIRASKHKKVRPALIQAFKDVRGESKLCEGKMSDDTRVNWWKSLEDIEEMCNIKLK
jgi:hypothetical protein